MSLKTKWQKSSYTAKGLYLGIGLFIAYIVLCTAYVMRPLCETRVGVWGLGRERRCIFPETKKGKELINREPFPWEPEEQKQTAIYLFGVVTLGPLIGYTIGKRKKVN